MEADFWRAKWRDGHLGWHRPSANQMLVTHLPALALAPDARVFVPLCGKTLDIGWLRRQGFRVAGAELVGHAVDELFDGLGLTPAVSEAGALEHRSAAGVDIFVGDLFALTRDALGPVDVVYDRAALVALPPEMRPAYARHLAEITAGAPQLLVTFDYDRAVMDGPPFSVQEREVRELYAGAYDIGLLDSAPVEGGLKGFCPASEQVWLLRQAR